MRLFVVRGGSLPVRGRGDESSALAHALLLIVASSLLSSGCLRFGYDERRSPAADGGTFNRHDAAPLDASAPADAMVPLDAAKTDATPDADAAAATPDATAERDAAGSIPDATTGTDATMTTPDARTADGAVDSDAGSDCSPNLSVDYCTGLRALAEPPQLDGALDCGPSLIELPAIGWNSPQTLPSDNHARYAAAWRPEGLYVYVEVDDPLLLPALASHSDPWCGDGVELYADADGVYVSAPDYDDPGAIQLLATAPAPDTSTALAVDARYHTRSQLRAGDWTASRHVAVPRTGGYAVEAFIVAADLDLTTWSLQSGGKVGFDIAINVSVAEKTQQVGCGYNLGQYYLRVSRSPCSTDSCRPYSNAQAFCTAVLE